MPNVEVEICAACLKKGGTIFIPKGHTVTKAEVVATTTHCWICDEKNKTKK